MHAGTTLHARVTSTSKLIAPSQIVFPLRSSIFASHEKERGGRTMAASWGLPSARPGFKNGAAPRTRLADMVRLTHPVANLLDCALDRRRPRPCHHPEATRLFVADVCCTCALLQAKAPQIGHYAPLGTSLVRLNRRTRTTHLKFPACRVISSGALARSLRRSLQAITAPWSCSHD